MGKRFLLYIDGYTKPIAITDPNEDRDIKDLSKIVTEMMTGSNMCDFSTENDSIIVKPNNIKAVYIANIINNNTVYSSPKKGDTMLPLNLDDIMDDEKEDDILPEIYDKPEDPVVKPSSNETFFETNNVISSDLLDKIEQNANIIREKEQAPKKKGRPAKAVVETTQEKEVVSDDKTEGPIIHEQRYIPLRK